MATQDIQNLIVQTAAQLGVDPNEALALARTESNFNPNAISSAGAIGAFQLMPETAKGLGVNPNNLEENIRGGLTYYKQQRDRFGSPDLAYAAYNAGPGRITQYGGIPPFPETQGGVSRFMNYLGSNQSSNPQLLQPELMQILQGAMPQQQQPNIDFSQLTLPQQNQGGWNTFRKVLGTIGALGGTAADVISAVKGNTGPGGKASLAAGLGLLDDAAKQEEQNRQISLLNELISNEQLPASNRAQIAAVARGVPQGIAQNLYPDPNEQLGKNLLNIGRAQDIYRGSPEGQAEYDARLMARNEQAEKIRAERKANEIEKLVNDIENIKSNPNATEQQKRVALSKQAYLNSITKEQLTPAQATSAINTVVKKDGILDETNTAYAALNRLNNLESILQQLPEGRIEGNLEKVLYKFRGDPAVAEYKSLTTLLSADVARKVLREVGNLNEEEQKRSLETVDLIGQTKQERLAKIRVLKDAMRRALTGSYGKLQVIGDTVGRPDLPDYLFKQGALTFEPASLNNTGKQPTESQPAQSSVSVDDLLKSLGGRRVQ